MINDMQNAKIDLIKKIINYANIADVSYAMLHYINENEIFDIREMNLE